jgi:hypothetical protein
MDAAGKMTENDQAEIFAWLSNKRANALASPAYFHGVRRFNGPGR